MKYCLSHRKQLVEFKERSRSESQLNCGVPHGSVLGPTLFLLYINDLLKLNLHGQIIPYADNTLLVIEASNWEKARKVAENDMHKIRKWLNSNLLTLNIDNLFCSVQHNERRATAI